MMLPFYVRDELVLVDVLPNLLMVAVLRDSWRRVGDAKIVRSTGLVFE